MSPSHRPKLYSVLAFVAGFAAALSWWLLQGHELVSQTSASEGLSAESAAAVIDRVAIAPEEVVLPSTLEAAGGPQAMLPEGAAIEPRLDTFQTHGDIAEMLVDVHLSDGSVDSFAAVMINLDGTWYLAYTVRGSGP